MQFSDFKGKENELDGCFVLWHYGKFYGDKSKSIRRIVKVTKTGFRIKNNDSLFSFVGYQKGLNGRENMGTVSYCDLISEEEAVQISNGWKEKRETNKLREEVLEAIKLADKDKLQRALEILKGVDKVYE